MEIITNIQLGPVDWKTPTGKGTMEYLGEELKGTVSIMKTYKTRMEGLNVIDYIPGIIDQEWPRLSVLVPQQTFVFDSSAGKYSFDKPEDISYVEVIPEEYNATDKMIVASTGVMLFLHRTFKGETLIWDIISAALDAQGVVHMLEGNDIIVNNRKVAGSLRNEQGNKYRLYGTLITIEYDDALFKKALPEVLYTREYVDGSKEPGITGIKQHYPDFNVNAFIQAVIDGVTQ